MTYSSDLDFATFQSLYSWIAYREYKEWQSKNPGEQSYMKVRFCKRNVNISTIKLSEGKPIIHYKEVTNRKLRTIFSNDPKHPNSKSKRKEDKQRLKNVSNGGVATSDQTHIFRGVNLASDPDFKIISSTTSTYKDTYELPPIEIPENSKIFYEVISDMVDTSCQTDGNQNYSNTELCDKSCQTDKFDWGLYRKLLKKPGKVKKIIMKDETREEKNDPIKQEESSNSNDDGRLGNEIFMEEQLEPFHSHNYDLIPLFFDEVPSDDDINNDQHSEADEEDDNDDNG